MGNGLIHFAFVLRESDTDKLYYSTCSLYDTPPSSLKVLSSSAPVLIDTADAITSVQIRHSVHSGITHLVYNTSTAKFSGGIPFPNSIELKHTAYRPKSSAHPDQLLQISTIASGVLFPFPASLDLRKTESPNLSEAGVAYISKQNGALHYAEKNESGSWISEAIESEPNQTVTDCDLAFGDEAHPAIAWSVEEDRVAYSSILFSRRTPQGAWPPSHVYGADPAGTAIHSGSSPDLFQENDTTFLVFVARVENTTSASSFITFGTKTNDSTSFHLFGSGEQSKNHPISEEPFRSPEIVVSQDRIVIAYRKANPTIPGRFDVWLASRKSHHNINSFSRVSAPPIFANLNSFSANHLTLSLDENGYPIASWIREPGSLPRACFCPDFTDYDQDGIPYLREKAFVMNPDAPDIHLAPCAYLAYSKNGNGRGLIYHLTVPESPHISSQHTFHTETFLYTPEESSDLANWQSSTPTLIEIGSDISPVPMFLKYSPLETNNNPAKYFRTTVFRR